MCLETDVGRGHDVLEGKERIFPALRFPRVHVDPGVDWFILEDRDEIVMIDKITPSGVDEDGTVVHAFELSARNRSFCLLVEGEADDDDVCPFKQLAFFDVLSGEAEESLVFLARATKQGALESAEQFSRSAPDSSGTQDSDSFSVELPSRNDGLIPRSLADHTVRSGNLSQDGNRQAKNKLSDRIRRVTGDKIDVNALLRGIGQIDLIVAREPKGYHFKLREAAHRLPIEVMLFGYENRGLVSRKLRFAVPSGLIRAIQGRLSGEVQKLAKNLIFDLGGISPEGRVSHLVREAIRDVDEPTKGLVKRFLGRLAVLMSPVSPSTRTACYLNAQEEWNEIGLAEGLEPEPEDKIVKELLHRRLIFRVGSGNGDSGEITIHPTVRSFIFEPTIGGPRDQLPNFTLAGFTSGTAVIHPRTPESQITVRERAPP